MTSGNQLTGKQRDDLLAGIQQLCLVYWGPSETWLRPIVKGAFLQPFEAVAPLCERKIETELVELNTLINGISNPASLWAYLEEGYVRLFINDRGGIASPLYASCYENEKNPRLMGNAAVRMKKTLADLKIHVSDDVGEPPDHLSIELEVLYFLLSQNRLPDRTNGLTTAADFVVEEMLPWVQIFHRRLADDPGCRFYPLITSVLLSILKMIALLPECAGQHPPQQPPAL